MGSVLGWLLQRKSTNWRQRKKERHMHTYQEIHHCPPGMPQAGALVPQLLTFRWGCVACRVVFKPGPVFSFLCQLIGGNSPRGHECRRAREGSVACVGTLGIQASSPSCLCLQGPFRPNHIHSTSIWRWSVAVLTQLYGWVCQTTPNPPWAAQVTWQLGSSASTKGG